MFDFVPNLWYDLHAATVHFPIAFLFLSFALTIIARFRPSFHETSWILLVVGVLSAIPATVTGLIAHEPYENTPVIEVIAVHQFIGLIGTGIMIALLVWRFVSRRRKRDIGTSRIYLAIAVAGLVWVFLLGGTGGNLVYQHGVNVRGINPLLK